LSLGKTLAAICLLFSGSLCGNLRRKRPEDRWAALKAGQRVSSGLFYSLVKDDPVTLTQGSDRTEPSLSERRERPAGHLVFSVSVNRRGAQEACQTSSRSRLNQHHSTSRDQYSHGFQKARMTIGWAHRLEHAVGAIDRREIE
jgi:hypothetical protein